MLTAEARKAGLEKIKARIKLLSERTVERGCSEAEAMAAASRVGALLQEHSLTMDEVMIREEPLGFLNAVPGGRTRGAVHFCVMQVAAFCECVVYTTKTDKLVPAYRFFGFKADVEMARYLTLMLDQVIVAETATFARDASLGGGTGRTASNEFSRGMAFRISRRLEAMTAERKAETARMSNGTALMVVKQAVVNAGFADQGIRLGKSRRASVAKTDAYRSGTAAGDRVNLQRPVGHSNAGAAARLA